jgi:hypothetical protein
MIRITLNYDSIAQTLRLLDLNFDTLAEGDALFDLNLPLLAEEPAFDEDSTTMGNAYIARA